MTALFLDTSYDQILGLLDDRKAWVDVKISEGQRLTGMIHSDLQGLCIRNTIHPRQIETVYYCAGPGFYTGLRVAYGIADILRLNGPTIKSFYSYMVPQYCGFKDYVWLTKAYRGEVFVFDSLTRKLDLLQEKGFNNRYEGRDVFTHSPTSIDEAMRSLFPQMKFSQQLLVDQPKNIFTNVTSEQELHYFRPLDEEYKPSL